MQPLSGNQRPDLLTCLMEMSFVLCLPHQIHLRRSSSNIPRLSSFLKQLQAPTMVWLTFHQVQNPLQLPSKSGGDMPGPLDLQPDLTRLSSKCGRVRFFNQATSKNGASICCFHRFDFETCFAPQPLALFQQLNVQNCFDNEVFLAF